MTKRLFYLYPSGLILLAAALILLGGARLSFTAITILLRQAAILGILCIGLSLVVLAGGIDLSVGAILSLGSGICSFILIQNSHAIVPAIFIAVLLCTGCGFLNGILIAYFGFPAAIVTFVQTLVYTGIGSFCTGWISDRVISSAFYRIFNGTVYGIPTSALFWCFLLGIVSLAMRYTYWGQYIYAIGDNEQALRMIGVNTVRYQVITYACCGFFAGISGIFMLARVSIATASTNITMVLEALAAISFSGIGFSVPYGKLPGLLIGTLTLAALKMCMTTYAVPTQIQSLLLALLFLISLFIGQILRNKR